MKAQISSGGNFNEKKSIAFFAGPFCGIRSLCFGRSERKYKLGGEGYSIP
jgi:hypothetical protein